MCFLAILISFFEKVLFSSVDHFLIGSLILGEFSFLSSKKQISNLIRKESLCCSIITLWIENQIEADYEKLNHIREANGQH
jgi:hypothetical protein